MDRVQNRICPCLSFRALRAAGVCTVVSHLVAGQILICTAAKASSAPAGAARSEAERAGIEIRRFRFPPRPCSALSDAGTQFFAEQVGRRDDGAAGPGQTGSHDPRPAKPCAVSARFGIQRLFFWTVHGPFSFRQDEKKMGGAFPAGSPRSPPGPPVKNAGAATRSPPLLCAVIQLEMPPLSGNLLHVEGLDDVACSGKAGLFRSLPGGHRPRRAEPACGKVSSGDETLGPADAGRRDAAQEGGRGPWQRGEAFLIWESPPW